jgi:hypothetical protein
MAPTAEIDAMYEQMQRRILRCLLCLVAGTVGGLALLWLLLVPNFGGGGCRLNANESAAIATLKNIHSGQTQFRDHKAIDTDGDGKGEFGWFAELSGGAPLRGSRDDLPLLTPVLSTAFQRVVAGTVQRSGYHFQMWLPGPEGTWRHEGETGPVDAAAAASAYRCAAWPNEGAGKRAFFGDEQGAVYACSNRYRVYQGAERPLPITAILLPVCRIEPPETPSTGGVWTEVQ